MDRRGRAGVGRTHPKGQTTALRWESGDQAKGMLGGQSGDEEREGWKSEESGPGTRCIWPQVPTLPFTGHMTLGNVLTSLGLNAFTCRRKTIFFFFFLSVEKCLITTWRPTLKAWFVHIFGRTQSEYNQIY